MNPDRKRRLTESFANESSASTPAAKKPAIKDEAPEEPNKTDTQLLLFQKDALWRELQQAKRNIESLESQLALARETSLEKEQLFLATQAFWTQMTDQLQTITHRVESRLTTEITSNGSDNHVWEIVAGSVKFNDNLAQLKHSAESAWARLDSVVNILSSSKTSDNGSDQSYLKNLEQRYQSTLAEVLSLKSQVTQLTSSAQSATERVESMTEELQRCQRQIDRLNSTAVARLQAADLAAAAPPAAPRAETESSSSSSTPTKTMAAVANDKEQEEIQMLLKKRTAEVEQLLNEKIAQNRQIERLQANLLLDTQIEQRPLFIDLKNRYELLLRETELLRTTNAEYSNQLEQAQIQRRQDLDKMDRDEAKRKSILEEELKALQSETARLRSERDSLRLQLDQANARQKSMEASLNDNRALNEKLAEEARSLGEHLRQNAANGEGDDALLLELDTIGIALEESQKERQRLLKVVAEKEETNAKLMAECVKMAQTKGSFVKEREQLQRKIEDLQKTLKTAKEVIQKTEAREHNMSQQLSLVDTQGLLKQRLIDEEKRRANESEAQLADIKNRLMKTESSLKQYQSQAEQRYETMEREMHAQKRAQEEIEKLKKQLEKAERNSSSHGNGDEALKEQIKDLNTLLNCSACHRNHKNTVITRCYHCFCKDCVDKRIETRQRKCPTCGEQFGIQDVKTLFL